MVQSNSVFYPKPDNDSLLSAKKNELCLTEFYSFYILIVQCNSVTFFNVSTFSFLRIRTRDSVNITLKISLSMLI